MVLGLIFNIVVIGMIADVLSRLVVSGRRDVSLVVTIVLDNFGSLVGGLLGYFILRSTPRTVSSRSSGSSVPSPGRSLCC